MTEEKNNTENTGSSCMFCKRGKFCGQNGMHRGCFVIRWVLGLLILWAVFMGGVKLGELKGMIDQDGFGRHNRSGYGYYSMPMMRGGNYQYYRQGNTMMPGYGYGLRDGSGIQQRTIPDSSMMGPNGQLLQ